MKITKHNYNPADYWSIGPGNGAGVSFGTQTDNKVGNVNKLEKGY